MLSALGKGFHSVKEIAFSFLVTVYNGLLGVIWKCCILNDELMQVVSQKVRTSITSVAIKYSEKAAFRPISNILLGWWLHDIEDNTYPILVIVSDNPLIGIGSISHDVSIFTHTALGWLPHWQIESIWIWRGTISEEQPLDI